MYPILLRDPFKHFIQVYSAHLSHLLERNEWSGITRFLLEEPCQEHGF